MRNNLHRNLNTTLNVALIDGRWSIATQMILENPSLIYPSVRSGNRRSALHIICGFDFDDVAHYDDAYDEALTLIQKIIECSIDIGVNLKEINIPVATLVCEHEEDEFESILTYRDHLQNTPLHILCGRGTAIPQMLQVLYSNCFDNDNDISIKWPKAIDLITATNSHGCTPLHFLSECRCDCQSLEITLGECTSLQPNLESLTFPLEASDVFSSSTNDNTDDDNNNMEDDTNHPKHPCLIQDEDGETPLHYAFAAGGPFLFVELLLENCPKAMTLYNRDGDLPIHGIWTWAKSSWEETIEEHNLSYDDLRGDDDEVCYQTPIPYFFHSNRTVNNTEFFEDKKLLNDYLWNLLNGYLEAYCFGTIHRQRNFAKFLRKKNNDNHHEKNTSEAKLQPSPIWSPIHAAVTLTHDRHILPFILQFLSLSNSLVQQRNLLYEYDENGKLPIHVVASTTSKCRSPIDNIKILLSTYDNADTATNKYANVAKNICEMKTKTKDQSLPFHLAIKSGKDIGVIQIFYDRCPEALEMPFLSNRLYPWMLASVDENNSLNVIYSLLRMNPELVRGGISPKKSAK